MLYLHVGVLLGEKGLTVGLFDMMLGAFVGLRLGFCNGYSLGKSVRYSLGNSVVDIAGSRV